MDIVKTTVVIEGSCNACINKKTTIWNIRLKTLSFRLCRDCRKELLKKLKEA